MALAEYRRKRRFAATTDPEGKSRRPAAGLAAVAAPERRRFSVQQHAATRLHYDLRLEMGGVLKSWAVPKGPTLDPEVRRLAIQTEDHPLEHLRFEGPIPSGNYGAGSVLVWDTGEYEIVAHAPPLRQWERGSLTFVLHGRRLRGAFILVKLHQPESKGNEWLLVKKRDSFARLGDDAARHKGSVISGPQVQPGGGKGRRRGGPATVDSEAATRANRTRVGRLRPPLPARSRVQSARPEAAAQLPGAQPAAMPHHLRTMLAMAEVKPFSSPEWLYEIKWDGVRALAYCRNGGLRLISRNGHDISRQYPELSALATAWRARGRRVAEAVVDGEIVALDAQGRASFSRLQQRMNLGADSEIARAHLKVPVVFYAFDLLYFRGALLLKTPLEARKAYLRRQLRVGAAVRFADHVLEDGLGLLALARAQHLEGVIAKRRCSAYIPGRSREWLKFKLERRQDAAIVGYTDPHARDGFGALLLAVFAPAIRRYRYIGRVGAGFSGPMRKSILARLQVLRPRRAQIEELPRIAFHPTPLGLVGEIKFLEWTPEGRLRAPVFLGLRADKRPRECVRE